MTILLQDIWPINNPEEYKVHFARWNRHSQPLEVMARSSEEWQGWQEYRPGRNDFNRDYIFSLAQFYHETDVWMFGGVFRVLERYPDRYTVEMTDIGHQFHGRLKLYSPYRGRTTRKMMEKHYQDFQVKEILQEPYSGRSFSGYDEIDLSFDELETLIRNDRPDWKGPLENIKGVYLITDTHTSRIYVGSAYGDDGIWSRLSTYIENGHGGNVELRNLVNENGLKYCLEHFRFALLEDHRPRTPDDVIIARETYWKRILLSRGVDGLNRN